MIYRIYNTETKLYSKGGTYYTKFNQVGKIWSKLGYVKTHLIQRYCRRLDYMISEYDRANTYINNIPQYTQHLEYYQKVLDNFKLMNLDIESVRSHKYLNNIPRELEVIEYDDNLVELRRFNARELYPEYI